MAREEDMSWFHGPLARDEAESLVKELGVEGGFLVRESAASPGDYVLTLLHDNEVVHYQVLRHGEDAFFSIDNEKKFHGLETVIEFYQEDANGLVTKLTGFCKKNLPPHDTRRHGRTNLLHRATKEGNYTVVSELLKCGYRFLEAKNQDGETAVHLASRSGADDILMKLIESGANVNCRDTAGHTPLHYASQFNHPSTVRILVQQGNANVQARNAETGWVPLHEAAARGHSDVVQVLLSLNVPAHPRTPQGETPLTLSQPYPECAKILQNYVPAEPTLRKESFYHGTLDRREAIQLLQEHGDMEGSYLVRFSDRHGGMHVLTLVVDHKDYHFQIKSKDNYYFIDDGPLFESMEHVINYYSEMQDGLPTVLKSPVPPKPKPPLPEFPRHGLSATLPLKKKSQKPLKDCKNSHDKNNQDSQTIGRRSSTPILQAAGRMGVLSRGLASVVTNGVAPIWANATPEPGCVIASRLKLAGDVLGEGEFGSVYKGTYELDDNVIIDVAVKTLRDEHIPVNRTEFLREAKVMTSLDHHCVVKLIGLSHGPPLMMVQEHVPLGSMLEYLIKFPERVNPNYDLKLWASQIACGMTYLEEKKFVHRDLAARNILLATRHQAKISDFGLSRVVTGDRQYYKATVGGRWPIKWYAPESFNFGTFSHASDVWSYGVTLWEMFSFGVQPYGDLKGSEVIKQVEEGVRLEKPEKCPDDVYQVMEKCWEYNASDRPTFATLLDIFSRDPEYTNIRQLVLGTSIS